MSLNQILSNVNSMLSKSFITREVKIAKDLNITIKTLSYGEQREIKELIPTSAKEDVLLYSQVEALEIVVAAITEINGVSVQKLAMEELETKGKEISVVEFSKMSIRKFLQGLPSVYMNHIIDEYNDLVSEQNKMIEGSFGETVENFSNPTSEE